jgi:hypothetical protein
VAAEIVPVKGEGALLLFLVDDDPGAGVLPPLRVGRVVYMQVRE